MGVICVDLASATKCSRCGVLANEMQLVIYLWPNPVRSFMVDVWDQTRRYLQCGPPQHNTAFKVRVGGGKAEESSVLN